MDIEGYSVLFLVNNNDILKIFLENGVLVNVREKVFGWNFLMYYGVNGIFFCLVFDIFIKYGVLVNDICYKG